MRDDGVMYLFYKMLVVPCYQDDHNYLRVSNLVEDEHAQEREGTGER